MSIGWLFLFVVFVSVWFFCLEKSFLYFLEGVCLCWLSSQKKKVVRQKGEDMFCPWKISTWVLVFQQSGSGFAERYHLPPPP